MKIAVLGAGISGLTAARSLSRLGEVTVFEARDRPGGNIRTEEFEGCRIEWGPNGFLDNVPATLELVTELGLDDRLAQARQQAARRYIFRDGKLRELPAKPPQFLWSDCLPLLGRLRVLLEPIAKKPPAGDESVYDFARRRIGRAAADYLVDAMVTGVFAGDPHRLSVASAFPKLKALEKQYGSLIRGSKGRGFGPKGTLTSFDHGLEVLIQTLAKDVDLRLSTKLEALPEGYDHIVCALPASKAADLLQGSLQASLQGSIGSELPSLLRRIPTAPVVVVALIFDSLPHVPDAFGFLVPRGQGLRILGTLYDSSIFPNRAPFGKRLVRTLIGGRRDPQAIDLSDQELLDIALGDLKKAWRSCPTPAHVRILRHPLGIAQYEIGHAELIQAIEAACPPGLHLIGSSYRGVALNACIEEGRGLVL